MAKGRTHISGVTSLQRMDMIWQSRQAGGFRGNASKRTSWGLRLLDEFQEIGFGWTNEGAFGCLKDEGCFIEVFPLIERLHKSEAQNRQGHI